MEEWSEDQDARLLRHTEELAQVGGWELDVETGQVYWTAGTTRIFDIEDKPELDLQEALEFFHPGDRPVLEDALNRCIDEGIPYDVTVRIITADGRKRWGRATGERRSVDGATVIRGAIRDVTSQKRNEERLMVLNRFIRHNIANDLTVIMGHTQLLEDEILIRDVPPDLRNLSSEHVDDLLGPLNQADTIDPDADEVQSLLDLLSDVEEDRAIESLTTIRETAQKILDTSSKAREIEQIFDSSTALTGVFLPPIIEDVTDTLTTQYPEAEISYMSASNPSVRGNDDSLTRAILELVENAIIHNDRSDPIVNISHDCSEEEVHISIEDNGPGIAEMERETLTRGEETPLMHGSGIGLWLVNWLVLQQDGDIAIRNRETCGTSVELTFASAE